MTPSEFDEMKKIWATQNNQPFYEFDEKALLDGIHSKMNSILRQTSMSEWASIMIYIGTGVILLGTNLINSGANISMYLGAAWMFITGVYLVVSRIRRIAASRQFDRSVHGDLDHVISLASYQMRVAQIIRWSLIPMGAIMIFSGWEAGDLFKVSAVILISYTVAFYVASSGYRANKRRRRELQVLKEKLETGS
jgi:hypothetical protein